VSHYPGAIILDDWRKAYHRSARRLGLISDLGVWRAPNLLIRRHGVDAELKLPSVKCLVPPGEPKC
jgi:hypothetical protein